MGNVDHRKGYACVRARNIQESLHSVQFCCNPKTFLKKYSIKNKERKKGRKERRREGRERKQEFGNKSMG